MSSHSDRVTRIGTRSAYKRYGSVQAIDGITFNVADAEIHAVVGENGAGKSTLMRLLQGLELPDSGSVVLDGQAVTFRHPRESIRAGVGMVHQEFMLAPELTLLENLVLGDEPVRRRFGFWHTIDWQQARHEAQALEVEAGVSMDWDIATGDSPVHVQQYVEIFRLLRRGSTILILDEPTAVLAPQQVGQLFTLLRRLRNKGATILFISHKLDEVSALADHVTIIRKGSVIASAPVDEMSVDTMTAYIMGADSGHAAGSKPKPVPSSMHTQSAATDRQEPVLRVSGLSTVAYPGSCALHDISLHVHSGEIVGLAGIAGNGQTELFECLAGLRNAVQGSIQSGGEQLLNQPNGAFRDVGIAYISPDRAHEGLARDASIEANVMAGSQRKPEYLNGPLRRRYRIRRAARNRLLDLAVQFDSLQEPASSLSGGNQQKLVFARETADNPSLLIVSQPTRGVDLNGIQSIHTILQAHRDQGCAILITSEELDELTLLCDRILVISGGELVGEVQRDEFSHASIGELMLRGQTARQVDHA